MMIEQHYDEEVLIALLDEQAPDPHLQSCATCKASLNSIRQVTSALHDETVWDRRELHEEPRPETRNALTAFATSVAREDAAAEPWVKTLLAKPASEWHAMVDTHPEWHTAGFVRKLIATCIDVTHADPSRSIEIGDTAIYVLSRDRFLDDSRLRKLRAMASRETAYTLFYVGRYLDALGALASAEADFNTVAVHDHDIARLQLIRAYVYGATEKLADAIAASQIAKATFTRFGDVRRGLLCDLFEGTVLIRAARFSEALAIQLAILNRTDLDAMTTACAEEHAATCCRELGHLSEARAHLGRAINSFSSLRAATNAATAKRHLAQLLTREGKYEEAIALLAAVRDEFKDMEMFHDVALAAVDASEAFLASGRIGAVAELCRDAMEFFRTSQLTYTDAALTALAYLREAAEKKSLTATVVRDIREFFEILPKQPHLMFARPA